MSMFLLLAVRTEGRVCNNDDVFPPWPGNLSTATIPANCSVIDMRNKSIGCSLSHPRHHHHCIGDTGTIALGKALETNAGVTELFLDHSNIGPTGAIALAEALGTNTALATLYLNENNIGTIGATALAKALGTNTALTTLSLMHDNGAANGPIGSRGIYELTMATNKKPDFKLIIAPQSCNHQGTVEKNGNCICTASWSGDVCEKQRTTTGTTTTATTAHGKPASSKSTNMGLLVGLVVTVLILILVGGLFVYKARTAAAVKSHADQKMLSEELMAN